MHWILKAQFLLQKFDHYGILNTVLVWFESFLSRCYQYVTFNPKTLYWRIEAYPYSKVHGANMGPIWVLSAPDGPHVEPMNLAIRVYLNGKGCIGLPPMLKTVYIVFAKKNQSIPSLNLQTKRKSQNWWNLNQKLGWCYLWKQYYMETACHIDSREDWQRNWYSYKGKKSNWHGNIENAVSYFQLTLSV